MVSTGEAYIACGKYGQTAEKSLAISHCAGSWKIKNLFLKSTVSLTVRPLFVEFMLSLEISRMQCRWGVVAINHTYIYPLLYTF